MRKPAATAARPPEILRGLVPIASRAATAQLDAFALRLADALMAFSEQSADPRQANLAFAGAGLLRKNTYAFYHLAAKAIDAALRREVESLVQQAPQPALQDPRGKPAAALELVSYEEMDNKVRLGHIARPFTSSHGETLDALNLRLACVLGRDEFQLAQNPFRPEVFLGAVNQAWAGFDPDAESHPLVLPLLRPDVFLDLGKILQAVNENLAGQGILPALGDSYRIRKSTNFAADQKREAQIAEGLRRMLGGEVAGAGAAAAGIVGGGLGVAVSAGLEVRRYWWRRRWRRRRASRPAKPVAAGDGGQ